MDELLNQLNQLDGLLCEMDTTIQSIGDSTAADLLDTLSDAFQMMHDYVC